MLDFLLGYGYGTSMSPGPSGTYASPSGVRSEGELRSKDAEIEARLNSLELACAGLWKLLKEKGLNNDELVRAIEAVDMMDGQKDGKIKPQVEVCRSCGRRALSRAVDNCLWCGAPMPVKHFGA